MKLGQGGEKGKIDIARFHYMHTFYEILEKKNCVNTQKLRNNTKKLKVPIG